MKNYPTKAITPQSITFLILLIPSLLSAQVFQLGAGLTATDTNEDGSVVVGDNGSEHFMWDETNGVQLIGGVAPQGFGGQTSVNGDGSQIAGTRINPNNNLGELSVYDVGTQMWTSLGSLGSSSGNSASSAWGFSSDGSTIVGLGWVNAGTAHAIKWTSGGGIEDLGSTVSGRSTRANKANEDGTIIGGWQDSSTGFRQGAVWTNGVQSLITHPNNDPATEVGAMSKDGVWMGGGQGFANNFQAWKWSNNTGIIDIGPAPMAGWRGAVSGLSADGTIAVGFYRPFPAPATFGEGFIHTDALGMVNLNTYATSLGIDTQGLTFALPLDISDDGTTIVGLTSTGAGFVLRLPLIPTNDDCAGALPLSCNAMAQGNTEFATDSGGNSSPDVFFSYTGSGTPENVTISLCGGGTTYDSLLRVYSDCTLATEIAMNDDFCGSQSEVTFESDGISTYIVMVEGAGSSSGKFVLQVTCEPVLIGFEDSVFQNLVIYPNPVTDQLNISSELPMDVVTISNISGMRLMQSTPNSKEASVQTANLASGMYFVTVEIDGQKRTMKFVK